MPRDEPLQRARDTERAGRPIRGAGIGRVRVCSRFGASRVAAANDARPGAGRRQWLFPCQVTQRRMASFAAQPEGTGQFLRDTAFLVAYLERPYCATRALSRAKTGSVAAVRETGTDPSVPLVSCSRCVFASNVLAKRALLLRLGSRALSRGPARAPYLSPSAK
jgi:hypothetical protein